MNPKKPRRATGWSENPKDERLAVCISESLRAAIEKSAERAGLPMATHARQLLRLAVERRGRSESRT
jgi:predicted DNA binding CopG/RHH family protein